MAKDAADVMTAARALDERMKLEVDAHMRSEREIDNVEVMVDGKEQFVRKMNDIRNRTLAERDGLLLDQRRYDQVVYAMQVHVYILTYTDTDIADLSGPRVDLG